MVRAEGKKKVNTRGLDGENMSKHMASIGFSLLHHQICTILIRTLGLFFFLLRPSVPFFFPSCQLSAALSVKKEKTPTSKPRYSSPSLLFVFFFYQTQPVKKEYRGRLNGFHFPRPRPLRRYLLHVIWLRTR